MFHIVFILDESLSMTPYISYYIKEINTIISTQKQLNPTATFTLVKFNDKINVLCVDSKISTLPEFTQEHYKPIGVSALYDAIGHGIELKATCSDHVIVIILTDGDDNNSKKFHIQTISQLISYYKQCGWEFVYIGANQNAYKTGNCLGIDICITYDETAKSITRIGTACNTAIGHSTSKWFGEENPFSHLEMPDDISSLIDDIIGFSI